MGATIPITPGRRSLTPCFWVRLASFARCIAWTDGCGRGGVLSKRIGPLSEDAIGYALERYDSQAVFRLGCDVARQLKRNGVFRSNWSRGLVVAAVDGIEICSSFARFCDHCMERKVTHLVEGEPREEMPDHHPHLCGDGGQFGLSHSTGDSFSEERGE